MLHAKPRVQLFILIDQNDHRETVRSDTTQKDKQDLEKFNQPMDVFESARQQNSINF